MTELRCRSGGGLVLVDRDTLNGWRAQGSLDEPDFAGLLGIAVDYEGRTDQVDRWDNEDWRDVWARESTPLVDRVNAGELVGLVFRPGDYHCDLEILGKHADSANSRTLEQWLFVPSGVVVIADLGKLAEDWEVGFPIEHDSFTETEVSVPNGWYKVTFLLRGDIPIEGVGRRRVYGSMTNPACVVRIEKSSKKLNTLEHLMVYPELLTET